MYLQFLHPTYLFIRECLYLVVHVYVMLNDWLLCIFGHMPANNQNYRSVHVTQVCQVQVHTCSV